MQLNKRIGISPGCSLLSAGILSAENNQKFKKARGTTDKNY